MATYLAYDCRPEKPWQTIATLLGMSNTAAKRLCAEGAVEATFTSGPRKLTIDDNLPIGTVRVGKKHFLEITKDDPRLEHFHQ